MFQELINLARQNAGTAVINNPSIPNEKNEETVQHAGTSIMSTLQKALSGGRINEVLSFFKNGGAGSHNIVREATGNFAQDLQLNLGLNQPEAQDVASQVVPQTMNQLASKTVDPNDNSFNIQDIFNKLSGGKTGSLDIQGMLQKFGGDKLDKNGDGQVNLQDLKSMFSNGGLMDNLKSFMK